MMVLPSMSTVVDNMCCGRAKYAPTPLDEEVLVPTNHNENAPLRLAEAESACAACVRQQRALAAVIVIAVALATAIMLVPLAVPDSELGRTLRACAQQAATALEHLSTLLSGRHGTAPRWSLALVLAFSSSTDNFAVGLSVALAGSRLPPHVNITIALCNAAGALSSAEIGELLGGAAPMLAPAAAGGIFLYLAWLELASWYRGESASPLARTAAKGLVWKLAVPMTLNNLAGGVASGVVGITPVMAGSFALLASYIMMAVGHFLGTRLGPCVARFVDPRVIAIAVFGMVAYAQLGDAYAAARGG